MSLVSLRAFLLNYVKQKRRNRPAGDMKRQLRQINAKAEATMYHPGREVHKKRPEGVEHSLSLYGLYRFVRFQPFWS